MIVRDEHLDPHLATGLSTGWQPSARFEGFAVAFGDERRVCVGGSRAFVVFAEGQTR
jgi:hypothetical protein